jgi:hypothetical protein
MDPELKRLLEEMNALTKENHRILRAIRRDQWVGFIGKVIFWIIVLALPLYFYQQYLEPIVSKFSTSTAATFTEQSLLSNIATTTELQKLINSYKGSQ